MEGTIESLHSRTESSTNSARLLVKSRLGCAGVEMVQQDSECALHYSYTTDDHQN